MPRDIHRLDPLKLPIDMALDRFREQIDITVNQIRPRPQDDPIYKWARENGMNVNVLKRERP
jgi:hypothetical protein